MRLEMVAQLHSGAWLPVSGQWGLVSGRVTEARVAGARLVCVKACSRGVGSFDGDGGQAPPKAGWKDWQRNAAQVRKQVGNLGLAAVLAYGLLDGITYTTFFILAFLSYEKSTGNNPAANIQALVGIVITMWAGNNVTRPFRLAGAAAIAPFLDTFLNKVQQTLKLPNKALAFSLLVASFASLCFSVIGLLILSRWGR